MEDEESTQRGSEGVKRPTEIVGSSESQRRDGFGGRGSKRW